jgi:PLD-like domain
MRFVAGPLNQVRLDNILHEVTENSAGVRAAVAYAQNDNFELFEACKKEGKALTYYGRYDYSIPVHPEVLHWFLLQKSPDLVCKLVPDILHAKVIWWEGAGVYIGSANLSGRAWNSNIEAGVFIEQDEMEAQGLEEELIGFFAALDTKATELNETLYLHVKAMHDAYLNYTRTADNAASNAFDKKREIPRNEGLASAAATNAMDVRRTLFLQEWNATLKTMHDIAERVSSPEHRPSWVPSDSPKGLQADQFLHAFYYQKVKEGSSFPFDRYFQDNRNRKEAVLTEQLKWWKAGAYDNEMELAALNRASRIQSLLSKGEILNLSEEEFVEMGSSIYAMRDYAFRQPPANIGLAPNVSDYELKAEAFARTQYTRRSDAGKSIRDTLYFVLYGPGGEVSIASRIWEAAHSKQWKIPGMGLSTLGEIVGWAIPDRFPPRNGRTSKALRALGNDVKVWNAM